MQRSGDPRALQRLRSPEFLAQRHQARHLGLGDLDLLAAEIGKAEVLHDIVVETCFSLRRHVEILQIGKGAAIGPPVAPPLAQAQHIKKALYHAGAHSAARKLMRNCAIRPEKSPPR